MNTIFEEDLRIIGNSLRSLNSRDFDKLVSDSCATIRGGGKLIVSGLGKNVALGEKFVGTMVSMGLPASFMHTNSAIHGDMGIIMNGDIVILLTKSGETAESIHLYNLLQHKPISLWLLTFEKDSTLARVIPNSIHLDLEHEGDLWNIVPNNSSILNLFVLQKLAMQIASEFGISLMQFKANHPGGHIGVVLREKIE